LTGGGTDFVFFCFGVDSTENGLITLKII
jgi:hypothetical protein